MPDLPSLPNIRAQTWVLLFFLFVVEYTFFYQYATREVIWAYPNNHDQLTSLIQAYRLYEDILSHGFGAMLRKLVEPTPQGVLFPIQGAFMCLLFGGTRISCLNLNFVYFVVLQLALFYTIRSLTGSIVLGFIGLGLLLSQDVGFFWAGGLFDFRIDFVAYCLYGTWVCMVLRSDLFRDKKWTAIAGGVAVITVLTRFITAAYIGAAEALVLIYLLWKYFMQRSNTNAMVQVKARLRGVGIFTVIVSIFVLPVFWMNRESIKAYYVVGHVTSNEKYIRANEAGVYDIFGHLYYYPASIARDHLGPTFIALSILLAAIFLLTTLSAREKPKPKTDPISTDALFFIVACVIAPVSILTLDVAKSPVVGSITAVPMLLAVAFGIFLMGRSFIFNKSTLAYRTCLTSAIISMLVGAFNYAQHLSTHGVFARRRSDVEQLSALYGWAHRFSKRMNWEHPVLSVDQVSDSLYAPAFQVAIYEKTGEFMDFRGGLGYEIFGVSEYDAIRALEKSDFVFLTSSAIASPYPFYQSMNQLRPILRNWCDSHLVLYKTMKFDDFNLFAYVRPSVGIKLLSGGWITKEGALLEGDGKVLDKWPVITMEGQSNFTWLTKVPTAHAELLSDNQPGKPVPATLATKGSAYRITIDLSSEDLSEANDVRIRLTFDTFFVPKKIGLNEDTRELVLLGPQKLRLAPAAAYATP